VQHGRHAARVPARLAPLVVGFGASVSENRADAEVSLHVVACGRPQRCKHFEIGGDKKGKGATLF
jgi:hypothetical protein